MQIRIGSLMYDVKPIRPEDMVDHQRNISGLFDRNKQLIRILEKQTDEQIADTILHECLHGIISHSGRAELPTEEEDMVLMFEEGLMRLFRDNPHLKDILFPESKRGKEPNSRSNSKSRKAIPFA